MKKAKLFIQLYLTKFKLIPYIRHNKLLWKDKFGTPRCELEPQLIV